MGAARFYTSDWLTGGLHLIIVIATLQFDSPGAWPYSLALMAAVSFFGWIAAYRRFRTTVDLPTSRVASAAQGYVELFGRSAQVTGRQVRAKLSGTPCCWFRYLIEERTSDDKWSEVDSGTSRDTFMLVDDTGSCFVDPNGAEVMCLEKQSWTEGRRRYSEWMLPENDDLYAIGGFSTKGGDAAVLDETADTGALLASWKVNQPVLLQRFDLDGDGKIDMKEWELARLQAAREVRKRHATIRSGAVTHHLAKPDDGRLFLLACDLPENIGRRFQLLSWAHVAGFFAFGIGSFLLFSL